MTLLLGALSHRRRISARAAIATRDTGGLNAASSLGDGLLWAVVSGAHPARDRVGGYQGQAEGAAELATDGAGLAALRSPGWSGAGWYWPTLGITLGTAYTVALRVRLDPLAEEDIETEGEFPKLLSIPWRAAATWEMPFGWHLTLMPLVVGAAVGVLRIITPVSGSQRNRVTSPADFMLLDGSEHTYGARVRADGNVDWLRDDEGVVGTTAWQDFAHAAPNLGDAPHLIALARHRLTPDEGTKASLPAAAIWNKALDDARFELFATYPWDLSEISTAPVMPARTHAWEDYVTLTAGATTRIHPLSNDSGTGLTIQGVTQPDEAGGGGAGAVSLAGTAVMLEERSTGGMSFSGAHTLDATCDFLILAAVYQSSSQVSDTAATYGGVTATLVRHQNQGNRRAAVWYIPASSLPSPGSGKNVVITGAARGYGFVVPLKVAAQSSPAHGGANVASGTSLGPTTVSLSAGGMAVQFGRTVGEQAGSVALGSDETHLSGSAAHFTEGTTLITGWYASKTASGSMSVSWGSAADGVHIVVGIEAGENGNGGGEAASVAIVDGTAIDVEIPEEAETTFDFTYTVVPAEGGDVDTATVHVDVFVPPPLGVDDSYTFVPGDTYTVSPLANDNAPAGSTITDVTQPAGVEGGTSVAIAANDTDLEITIDAGETGSFEFTYTADGPGVSPWTQTVTVAVHSAVVSDSNDEPYLGRYYGSLINLGSGVANTTLRYAGANMFTYYFVGPRTGFVEKISLNRRIDVANTTVATRTATGADGSVHTGNFDVSRHQTNYGGGNGGTYNIYVYPADPNTKQRLPGSSPIGGRTAWPATDIVRRTGFGNNPIWGFPRFVHPIVPCDEPFFMEAGQPYVLAFDNVSSNPSNNYFSVNWIPVFISDSAQAPPSFVGAAGSGWTPTAASGGIAGHDWHPWPVGYFNQGSRSSRHGALLAALWWTDGYVTGYGAGGGGQRDSSSGLVLHPIRSNDHIRERFMPSFDGLVVDGIWFWALRKGSQSGSVVGTVEQGPASDTSGNGTVLREASISINSLTDVGGSYSITANKVSWVFMPFASPVELLQDTVYNLRLRVSGSGTAWMGSNGGFEDGNIAWSPVASSWAEHKASTKRSLDRWRDSRGRQLSSDGGTSWSALGTHRTTPMALRRTTS